MSTFKVCEQISKIRWNQSQNKEIPRYTPLYVVDVLHEYICTKYEQYQFIFWLIKSFKQK